MTRRVGPRFAGLALAAVIAAGAVSACGLPVVARTIPDTISDSVFWNMFTDLSEEGGYFRSDNFVSNEMALQHVIPEVKHRTGVRGVYLGVGPEQNFTYIVALRPRVAFIVDIRRQNAIEHLMYKALMELSDDRADFLSKLFSRPRPDGLDSVSSVNALMAAYATIEPDPDLLDSIDVLVERHLRVTHGFELADEDVASLAFVHTAFYQPGPDLTYTTYGGGRSNFGSVTGFGGPAAGGGGFGGRPSRAFARFPTFAMLMASTDGDNAQRGFLATEENYRSLRDMQRRNLIVPVVGNFAGPKALRAVGAWVRARDANVTTFYLSNVEQYLFNENNDWRAFYKNVATLPIDSGSTFIRSASPRIAGRSQIPNQLMTQLTQPIHEQLAAVRARRIQRYSDVIVLSR